MINQNPIRRNLLNLMPSRHGTGSSPHKSEGSRVRRSTSRKIYKPEGSQVRRSTSPKVHKYEGSQVRRSTSPKVHKSYTTLILTLTLTLRTCAPSDLWTFGLGHLRTCEPFWNWHFFIIGLMNLRTCEPSDLCTFGLVNLWTCGLAHKSEGSQVRRFTGPKVHNSEGS